MNVLAIDQGTSSTKALVVGPAGHILAEAEVPVHPKPVGRDGVAQNPNELWNSVLAAGREVLARAAAPVAAVGLANQGETTLAWDCASGAPLSPAISWQDRRSATVCERLATHAEELRALTGLPLDSYFAAPKMAWLRETVARQGVCTTTDTWLLHRLTGAFVTDATTASRTLLLDLDQAQWSPRACEIFDVDLDSLPRIVGCSEVVGETSGFGPTIAVVGLATDQQAALFAQGCWNAGDSKCTYGTGAFLLTTTGREPVRSRSGLVSCVAWRLDGETTYCLDGQAYTVGAAVEWLRRIGVIDTAADLDALGGQVPSANGVVFVPALAGLGAPHWSPRSRGTFVGLSLDTERAHLVRAVVEGIGAQVASLADAVAADRGAPLTRLRADGGLTRSRALMQAQADLLQIPVEVSASPQATAIGIAALTRLGIGAAKYPAQAIGSRAPAQIYEPRMSADEAGSRRAAWQRAVDAAITLTS
ncbi:MAG TPA: FGGY family carbohydrate kinase [Candidatus Binatia bacterium]|nr:FGGY family carbohydrate kinase [Candidatus Binatia bacterium]